jgi:ABC-type transport system involved in multi-copper enzyme maturation permease subunit
MLKRLTLRFASHIAHAGLPLLSKELIEQAARRRTFVIRVVYATILFLMSSLFFYQTLEIASGSPLAVLGHGKDMFGWLVGIQFAGIYFFMPAMTSGVITQEKERASLQLLFLTRLGPWTILFEKLLGRLVPMGCFLLLSLPLLGFAYTLGGVSRDMLWKGTWMLFLATIQMGTLALMCSAFFRTTVVAFMASYVIAFVMFFGPYFCFLVAYLLGLLLGIDFERLFTQMFPNPSPGLFITGAFPFFTPPYFILSTVVPGGIGTWPVVIHSVIILSVSGGCLALARRFIVARAFLPSHNAAMSLFKAIDRGGIPMRNRQTATQVVHSDDALLPADEPIAWRETTKRLLGHTRYMWRIVLVAEVPLIAVCLLIGVSDSMAAPVISAIMTFVLWMLAVLVISVKSASLVAGERTHQTLDVLCASPLTGREIVLQKFRGVRRLIVALWAPFLTISLFVPWWHQQSLQHRNNMANNRFSAEMYLACAVLSVGVYFPLVAWLSFSFGLTARTQIRAIIGSMAAVAVWCIAPVVFFVLPLSIMARSPNMLLSTAEWQSLTEFASLFSPATIVFVNEGGVLHEYPGPWISVWLNFAFYGAALVAFRALCLKNADRWLGRATGIENRE